MPPVPTPPQLPGATPIAPALLSPQPTATERLLASPSAAPSGSPTAALAPAARAYLDRALDWIAQNSIYRDTFDWTTWRQKVLAYPVDARSTADTYPAIRYALSFLHDGHDQFFTPEQARATDQLPPARGIGLMAIYPERRVVSVISGGSADRAGVQVGDVIEAMGDQPADGLTFDQFYSALFAGMSTQLTLQHLGGGETRTVTIAHDDYHYPATAPTSQRLPGDIGMIALPNADRGTGPVLEQYAALAQQEIRQIDQTPTCGWIVDLRDNGGGAIWPMLAGIGPVLGDGLAGWFLQRGGRIPWSYLDGDARHGDAVAEHVSAPYQLSVSLPPVAILTNQFTSSAAEALVISFNGRPATRRFGQPTGGAPNAPERIDLSDGAQLEVAVTMEADRNGHVFDGPIAPDERVPADRRLTGTDRDPVVLAARRWLSSQPPCAP